jgi:hypothetical protein
MRMRVAYDFIKYAIVARYHPELGHRHSANIASRRAAEKAGFTYVGAPHEDPGGVCLCGAETVSTLAVTLTIRFSPKTRKTGRGKLHAARRRD